MTGRDQLEQLITAALEEDVGPGDFTSLWTVGAEEQGAAVIVAKERLVVAGMDAACRVFLRVDPKLVLSVLVPDGEEAGEGDVLMKIQGPLRGILTAERTALNFLGRLSGIATLTRRYVEETIGTGATILDTRKTTPGWRVLEKAAVSAGGGGNHRMGLHDMILIKDNHVAAAGGVRAAVERVRRENAAGLQVEVEVARVEELREALEVGVDRILLDNMSVEEMAEAVRIVHGFPGNRPQLEASGNMELDRVRQVAETGVDFISVGALTHSAPMADLSLRVARS